MKIVNLKRLATSVVTMIALAGAAQAQVVDGGSSDASHNKVGLSASFGPMHPSAKKAGLSAQATGIDYYVAFQDLKNDGVTDGNRVTTINNPTSGPNDHRNLGLFHFAQVANNDVWFGEWAGNATSGSTDHTVYYAGTSTGTTVPTSGTASYSVKGINNYAAASGLLSGTFNANFTAKTLTGSIANAAYSVNIGNATITNGGVISSGNASNSAGNTGGSVNGRFFGAGAAALAGIVTFAGARQNDTAFGGTRN
ncbi:Slam-dependent surface lipoprotein [Sphingomonas morindae]|uniref:Transferrin-binding protein-like solute binding protein n=1 Tax=Sphingomonas morindae TaxID=1541170 RepID=A0ABY4X9Q9_9SPHN|nr:Slam-dependent surface lipoprotein [Sphingomonas morindae]USI73659.1 transferrin-binding protein-like solute binding protein [Sphingomonas morindae]